MAAREAQFAVPHSLGENPFPEADTRHAQWEQFSAASMQRVERLVHGLLELSTVIDAASYSEWRTRYQDAPIAYDSDRVASWLSTGRQIFKLFDKVAGGALDMLVRGPEGLKLAQMIIEDLAASLRVAIGSCDESAMSTRLTRWRESWLERAQLYVSPQSAGESVPPAPLDKWFLPDAEAASYAPSFFRSVKSQRLQAIATLRREMTDTCEKARPKTTDDLYRELVPAMVRYAEDLFSAASDERLQRGLQPRSYERWLDKCESAVISDCCEDMGSQFPTAVGLLSQFANERQMPETFRSAIGLWGAWNPFSSAPFRDELKNYLRVHLRTQTRLRWLAKAPPRVVNAGRHSQKESGEIHSRLAAESNRDVTAAAKLSKNPAPEKPRGAPRKPEADKTRVHWETIGKPMKLTAKVCDALAEHSYPDEYAKAKLRTPARKRLRDRVSQQVRRLMIKAPASAAT